MIAETIHEKIRNGQLKPGDRLDSVEQLAKKFRVGRAAVREALSALRAMGLIEMKQGEGTFVKSFELSQITYPLSTAILMNKEDMVHLVEVRQIVETGAAAAAAIKRTEEDLIALSKALEKMRHIEESGRLGEDADFQFHIAIARAAHNPILLSMLDHIAETLFEAQREIRRVWIYSNQTTVEKLYEEHKQIYLAIEEQDEKRARKAMEIHLQNVEKILQSYIESTEKNK